MQMEIEVAALKKEEDRLSAERLTTLQAELAEQKAEFDNRKAQWDNEKACVEKLSKLREDIEELNNQIQIAQREGNLEKAAELSYGKLPELKKQLEIEEEAVNAREMSLVHESVSEDEIAKIISRWTGIPVSKLNEHNPHIQEALRLALTQNVSPYIHSYQYEPYSLHHQTKMQQVLLPIPSCLLLSVLETEKNQLACQDL